MQRRRLTLIAGTTAAIGAAVLVATAGVASAEPVRPSPGAGVERMYELMQQGNPRDAGHAQPDAVRLRCPFELTRLEVSQSDPTAAIRDRYDASAPRYDGKICLPE